MRREQQQSPCRRLALRFGPILGLSTVWVLVIGSAAFAQLDDSCVVSALNRTAPVAADGTWVLPNVPTNLGQVRVRATCVENGVTTAGQSDFIQVPLNDVVRVPEIRFDAPQPIPSRLEIMAATSQLTAIGESVQLAVSGHFPDGSTADLTTAETGTSYTISNSEVATLTADSLVIAQQSGAVIVSAAHEGTLGLMRIEVIASGDTDNDGLPDDFEIANGLDPNNAADAFGDPDADGLTNLDEFQAGTAPFNPDTDGDTLLDGEEVNLGTNPLLPDTDGDQVSDGLERFASSNPLDANDVNLSPILDALSVSPTSFTLTFNTVVGEASRQLVVTGTLIDGTVLDITAPPYGTTYTSSDLTIASFGAEVGRVFAGQDGTARVAVSNGTHASDVDVAVRTFSPTALSFLRIPGFANGVAVQGDYAYVAAGDRGLYVVDISDLEAPFIAGSWDTSGNINDVRVAGDYAYLASSRGFSGLLIVDVGNAAAPQLVGVASAAGGQGTDLALADGLAFLATGTDGLKVFDISDPQDPNLLGSLDTPGNARGVDVSGDLVVVASDQAGVLIIDANNPTNPVLLGSTHTRGSSSRAADLAVRERLAYVADGARATPGGLRVINFSEPTTPFVAGSTGDAFGLTGVALERNFALTSDFLFANAVPIFNVATPSPLFNALLDFSGVPNFRDDQGTGIVVRDGVVFLTAAAGPGGISDNGVLGDSGLFIGRYLDPESFESIPPTVSLTSPEDGSSVLERRRMTMTADATDDIQVAVVEFLIDGEVVHRDFRAPFEHMFITPQGVSTLALGARALDLADNEGIAEEIRLEILPDALPTATLLSPSAGAQFTEGTVLTVAVQATDDTAIAEVELQVDGAPYGSVTAQPYQFTVPIPLGATELSLLAIATDEVGQAASAGPVVVEINADQPPQASLISPLEGAEVVAGGLLRVVVGATDDVGVERVRLWVDDQQTGENLQPPYTFEINVPVGVSSLTLTAEAIDTLERSSFSETIQVQVVTDPATVVFGRVIDAADQPVAGADVATIGLRQDLSDAEGFFSIPDVPTIEGDLVVTASAQINGAPASGDSPPTEPNPGGITDVGDIQLVELPPSEICPCSDPANWSNANGVLWSYFLDGTIGPSSCTDTATATQLSAECVAVRVDASASQCQVVLPCGGTNLALPISAGEIEVCQEALRQAATNRGVSCNP